MRHLIFSVIASIVFVQGARAENNCSLNQVTEAAKEAGKAVAEGKPTQHSPCFNFRSRKGMAPKKSAVAKEQISQQPQQSVTTTVVSPIIIVTGAPQQPPRSERASKEVRKTVVPRDQPAKVVKQIVRVREKQKKNTISAVGGMAPTKVSTSVDGNEARVKTELGPVFGVQYQRHFDNSIVIGIGVLSNTTLTFSAGLDF